MDMIPHWYSDMVSSVSRIDAVAFSPDSSVLYGAGGFRQGIVCWDVETGEQRESFAAEGERLEALAAHPTEPILASGGVRGLIQIWDTRSAQPLLQLRAHPGAVLASGGRDHTLRLWDVRAGRCTAILPDAGGWPDGQDFDPARRHLASVTTDGAVALWDMRTGQRGGTFLDYEGEAQVIAYHPRGDCLAIATDTYTIACWYPDERRVETIFCGYDTSVGSLRFDPSGSALIAGMGREDVPIRVWDLVPPHATSYVRGRSDEVVSIAISPDGRYLACGSTGRTAVVETWRLVSDGSG